MVTELCPLLAMYPLQLDALGIAWVQHNGQIFHWNHELLVFEIAEGPLLPEEWAYQLTKDLVVST